MKNTQFPLFTSSDPELNKTWQYRCQLYQKHIKETPQGHVISEFLPDVPWAGIYNTISCAAMHHFREGRWMQDPSVLEEYASFWCTAGNPRLYSFPIADSVLALAKVTGRYDAADRLYPALASIHQAWDDHKTDNNMYRQSCDRDGMEYSISGDGLRPTINSYLYADKMALSQLALRAGDETAAKKYYTEAAVLRQQINEILWNEETGMFGVVSEEGVMQNVREQIGYIPWIYHIPSAGKDACFRYLWDPDCFLAPYGLRTADVTHPDYRKPIDHECLWNGPVWPFATCQTLTAMIEYLHTSDSPVFTADAFMEHLLTYAYSHRDEDGSPYLDENMDPDTGIWLAREILRSLDREDKARGRHYNHSTFIDLVMTGLCGICPAEDSRLVIHPLGTCLGHFTVSRICYHGHTLSVNWKKGDGLRVVVDDGSEYFCKDDGEIRIEIYL